MGARSSNVHFLLYCPFSSFVNKSWSKRRAIFHKYQKSIVSYFCVQSFQIDLHQVRLQLIDDIASINYINLFDLTWHFSQGLIILNLDFFCQKFGQFPHFSSRLNTINFPSVLEDIDEGTGSCRESSPEIKKRFRFKTGVFILDFGHHSCRSGKGPRSPIQQIRYDDVLSVGYLRSKSIVIHFSSFLFLSGVLFFFVDFLFAN